MMALRRGARQKMLRIGWSGLSTEGDNMQYLKSRILPLTLFASFGLTGCVSPIGQEDFTCNAERQGGHCGGPRVIYEMTNTASSVNEYRSQRGLSTESNQAGTRASGHSGTGLAPATGNRFRSRGDSQTTTRQRNANDQADSQRDSKVRDTAETVRYAPRSDGQQRSSNYERPEELPQARFEEGIPDSFGRWPGNGEPLAPEPLAVLEAPQVMRVLVAPWTDDGGNLNLSSYVYVEVTPRQWSFGEAANSRPSRVIPYDIRQSTQEELRRNHERSQGVSPLDVMTPMYRGGN